MAAAATVNGVCSRMGRKSVVAAAAAAAVAVDGGARYRMIYPAVCCLATARARPGCGHCRRTESDDLFLQPP